MFRSRNWHISIVQRFEIYYRRSAVFAHAVVTRAMPLCPFSHTILLQNTIAILLPVLSCPGRQTTRNAFGTIIYHSVRAQITTIIITQSIASSIRGGRGKCLSPLNVFFSAVFLFSRRIPVVCTSIHVAHSTSTHTPFIAFHCHNNNVNLVDPWVDYIYIYTGRCGETDWKRCWSLCWARPGTY